MNDKSKIIAGLIIFIAIITLPLLLNIGRAKPAPEPVIAPEAKAAGKCVRETEYMTTEHMQLLDVWREEVVRKGNRMYVNSEGKEFDMSLSNTCLDCHSNKADFCDKCHTYASVDVYCWDCHIENPKEKK